MQLFRTGFTLFIFKLPLLCPAPASLGCSGICKAKKKHSAVAIPVTDLSGLLIDGSVGTAEGTLFLHHISQTKADCRNVH